MLSKEELLDLLIKDVALFNNEIKSGEADLTELDFSNMVIDGAVFDNADLTSSSFADAQLTEATFIGCDLTSVDFTRSSLTECNFNEAILNGTDFNYSVVNYCTFNDADLAGAVLCEADLSNSDFTSSENLNASRFDDTTIWPDTDLLPEDFDSTYSDDLSSLKDNDDYEQSDY